MPIRNDLSTKLIEILEVLLLITLLVLAAGCGPPPIDPKVQRLYDLFIRPSDLPAGWRYDTIVVESVKDAVSRTISYRGASEEEAPFVLISQQLVGYPDRERAILDYTRWLVKEFPHPDWKWPAQVEFQSSAEQFDLGCIQMGINNLSMHSCTALARYDATISILYVNIFDNRWFTFDDFERLLGAIDIRFSEPP